MKKEDAYLDTPLSGLTDKEAERRLKKQGPNKIERKTAHAFTTFVNQFKSPMVYLLAVASFISYIIRDYSDGTIILAILLLNASLGFYQEYKSEKIIEKLSHFITKQIRVKRGGKVLLLDEYKIVSGDIVIVHEGEIVPADMRLIESENLQVNESQLTGESIPVIPEKFLFAGSIVEKGVGTGVVYATGRNTKLGMIATLSTETKKETQYEKSLKSFSSLLMKIVLIGLSFVFVVKLFLNQGSSISNLLIFIIALAVSTVPEVLPVIATVTLSSGALKLAKKHVVVKRLSALEDLGNVNLLCTDKTGTLTENKMVIHTIVSDDTDLFQKLAYAAITPVKGRKHRTQNSYDDAFLAYVKGDIQEEATHLKIVDELFFDPDDRRRRVILEDPKNHTFYLVVLGAPEVLLKIAHCTKKSEYLNTITQEGSSGLHHIALAYKEVSYVKGFDILKHETGLHFLGYVGFDDPLRPSAKSTIEHAEKMGIKIKVLTGDSREVAQYVGRQVGLVRDGDKVYSGDELEKMSSKEFDKAVRESNVFARVSPTQKFNIIQSLKKEYVIAYQGDGINDAPALKLADVAIAVNSATDIAKENADIILLNRSLGVIVNGITYGRSIFVNINKYIKYTMVNNFGIFIALSVLYLFSASLPILPIQALLNNLFGDIPLITVFSDTVEDDEIVRPEKHNVRELVFISLLLGLPTALFELVYFMFIRTQPERIAQTSLYVFLTFQALIIFYTIRTKKHFWKAKKPSPLTNIFFGLAFILSLIVVYIPELQTYFYFVPLTVKTVVIILGLMCGYFLLADFVKVRYYDKIKVLS